MSIVQQDASDIKINFLELVTPTVTFDLQQLFVSMNIYEDLFGGSVTMDLFLNDSINLPYKAPILGEEYLNFTVSSKSVTGEDVELNPGPMYIVSITDRHLTKDRQQMYILHFTSEQDIVNSNTTVSRSFRGKTISTIVSTLLNEYIDLEPDSMLDGNSGLQLGDLHSLALDTDRGRIRSLMLPWTIGVDLNRSNLDEGIRLVIRQSDLVGLRQSEPNEGIAMGMPSAAFKRLLWFDLLMTAWFNIIVTHGITQERDNKEAVNKRRM